MTGVPDILLKIAATKREETAGLPGRGAALRRQALDRSPALDFPGALRRGRPAVIAEVKKASPSVGVIAVDFDPISLAEAYVAGGADAISALTDKTYFQGDAAFLEAIKARVSIPVLRKDFIIIPEQIYESRAIGADTFLLIVALLSPSQLREYLEIGRELGMEALVESHDEEELSIAIAAGARVLGVNNRNLRDFSVDLGVTERLLPLTPPEAVKVGESGVKTPEDAARLFAAGCDAVLVGEALTRAPDRPAMVRNMKTARPH